MPTPPRDRRLLVSVRRQRTRSAKLRRVFISEATDEQSADVMLVPVVSFDVTVNEWGDVIYSSAQFPLPPSPSPHDFRIPFGLYANLTRRALHDLADEGDVQYEVRGGRIYDYAGNILRDPPRPPRTPRRPDPRADVDLKEVARVYNTADRAPTKTVAQKLHLSVRTAERRVAAARELGLIPPLRRAARARAVR
jgi:hypothetical protein